MRRPILLMGFVWLATSAIAQTNYLTTDAGDPLTAQDGQKLLAQIPDAPPPPPPTPTTGQVGSIVQVRTWGPESATRPMVTLTLDVLTDLSAVLVKGVATEGDKAIATSWIYVNKTAVKTCTSGSCEFLLPRAKMKVGVNNILFSYRIPGCVVSSTNSCARGTSTDMTRP